MEKYETAARQLRDAYKGETVSSLRGLLETDDTDGAYQVQDLNTRFWKKQGRRVVGRKIGLTAKAVQQLLGVDHPDFGILFDDMRVANGSKVSSSALIQPRAEAEIALVMGKDLDNPSAGPEDVRDAIDHACAAIEIVDSRIADWKVSFVDTVADNGSAAGFVLGDEKKPLDNLDLYSCGMVMEVNGEIASLGAGAACLGHPLNAMAWLASTLARRGDPLRAGDIILTGALAPPVALQPGQTIAVKIGGLGSATFTYGD